MLDKSDRVDGEKEESVQETVRDGDIEKLEPDQDDSKEEESIPDDGKKKRKFKLTRLTLIGTVLLSYPKLAVQENPKSNSESNSLLSMYSMDGAFPTFSRWDRTAVAGRRPV